MHDKYYLLRIELLEIEPKIWRDFVVPYDISLDRLHDVIQIVMGWTESHLYQFVVKNKKYSEFIEYLEDFDDVSDSRIIRLNQLMKRKNQKINYEYDFGDGWDHEITLLNSNYDSRNPYELECLDGKRCCPPEDVGGPYGYAKFLEVINNPSHEDFEYMMMWAGEEFDSEDFDLEYINYELIKYYNHARFRSLPWGEN